MFQFLVKVLHVVCAFEFCIHPLVPQSRSPRGKNLIFLPEVLFFFILQYLSRAIVLTSFDDATRSFEERQRTKKLLGDQLASFFKLQVWESGRGRKNP